MRSGSNASRSPAPSSPSRPACAAVRSRASTATPAHACRGGHLDNGTEPREEISMKTARTSLAVSALALVPDVDVGLAEELRFTVWTGNEAHLEMLNGIAESFKATHPDVTVKFETIPAGRLHPEADLPDGRRQSARPRLDDGGCGADLRECRRADGSRPGAEGSRGLRLRRLSPSPPWASGTRATRSTAFRSPPRPS